MLNFEYKLHLTYRQVNGTAAPGLPNGTLMTRFEPLLCYSGLRKFWREMMPDEQKQVQIKADEKELLGQYANLVMIHHNAEEFTLNFIYLFPSFELDSKSRPRQAPDACAPGECHALRGPIRRDPGRPHACACANRWIRPIEICLRPSLRIVQKERIAGSHRALSRLGAGSMLDNPRAIRLKKFDTDGIASARNRLAISDPGHAVKRARHRRNDEPVVRTPSARSDDSGASSAYVVRERRLDSGQIHMT
jgi:hypothetical protein